MSYIICHRGASKFAPENTMPAFTKAIELEADGVEFDIHLTKDKKMVVCHNYTIDETSDGRGEIKNLTLDELKKFDFGIKFSPEFKGTRIPTLQEVMDKVSGMKMINIELKGQFESNEELASLVLEETEKYDIFNKIVFSSFDHELLKILKSLKDDLIIGALFKATECVTDRQFKNNIDFVLQSGFQAIHPHALCIGRENVDTCHEKGIKVNTWGGASVNRIQRMIEYGCDAIITNEILIAKSIMERKNR